MSAAVVASTITEIIAISNTIQRTIEMQIPNLTGSRLEIVLVLTGDFEQLKSIVREGYTNPSIFDVELLTNHLHYYQELLLFLQNKYFRRNFVTQMWSGSSDKLSIIQYTEGVKARIELLSIQSGARIPQEAIYTEEVQFLSSSTVNGNNISNNNNAIPLVTASLYETNNITTTANAPIEVNTTQQQNQVPIRYESNELVYNTLVSREIVLTEISILNTGDPDAARKITIILRNYGMNHMDIALKGLSFAQKISIESENQVKLGNEGACKVILDIIIVHETGSSDLTKLVFQVMLNMCVQEMNQREYGQLGGCEIIVKYLSLYKHVPVVVKEGLWCIRNLTVLDYNKTKLAEINSFPLILEVLQTHGVGDKDVAKQGLMAVVNLAVMSENRVTLGSIGACQVTVNVLSALGYAEVDVAKHGCWAIRNLSLFDENKVRMGQIGACPLVLQMLTRHASTSTDVAIQGLMALINLSVNKDLLQMLITAGACSVIVEVMKTTGRSNAEVAKQGVWAVRNMATSDESKLIFGREGGCEIVVELIRIHGFVSAGVALQGLFSIVNLSVNKDNQKKLGQLGACGLVLQLLQQYATDNDIAKEGFWAIRNLASDDENKVRFGNEDGCNTLINTLRLHINSPFDTGLQGLFAIVNLSVNKENQGKLIDGCKVVLDLLIKYGLTNIEIAKEGLWAIRNLAAHDLNKVRIGDLGGCAVLAKTLGAHTESRQISLLLQGLFATVNVSVDATNQTRLGQEGICSTIIDILKIYGETESDIAVQGAWCIRNLSANDNNKISMGNGGACEVLLHLISIHGDNIQFMQQSLFAIINLSVNSDNQVKFGNLGACEVIFELVKNWTSNKDLTRLLFWCMRNLSCIDENKNRFAEETPGEDDIFTFIVNFLNNSTSAESDIIIHVLWVIQNLSANNNFKEKFIRLGIYDVFPPLLNKFPEKQDVEDRVNHLTSRVFI